ncbi:MAG: hypothetical protein AAFR35_06620 [Pseudomonadota bacterium]
MSDWVSFEGIIEPLAWSKATHSILRIPDNVAETSAHAGARRVEGKLADHPINLALTKAPAKKRRHLSRIENANCDESRTKRIAALTASLGEAG